MFANGREVLASKREALGNEREVRNRIQARRASARRLLPIYCWLALPLSSLNDGAIHLLAYLTTVVPDDDVADPVTVVAERGARTIRLPR